MKNIKRKKNILAILLSLTILIGLLFATIAIDQPVHFQDPNLEIAIRNELNKPLKALYTNELNKIVQLDASYQGITSLDGIEYLNNLAILNLEGNEIQDVRPLGNLKKLHSLNLGNNGITDLERAHLDALSNLPLQRLDLNYNVIIFQNGQIDWLTNISALQSFTLLEELVLSENQIEDISALSSHTNLQYLDLASNNITNISPLANASALQHLNLANNNVQNIDALANKYQLAYLNLFDNQNIISVSPLNAISNLEILILDNVPIGDEISVLENKHELRILSMANSQLTSIAPLDGLTLLSELNLRDNDIVDLAPLSSLARLKTLDLQSNSNINSIQQLTYLIQLKELDLQNVPVGDEIVALATLEKLISLDARNCAISDISVLGQLMENGTLQDSKKGSKQASIDLRDNPLSVEEHDSYLDIRPYWENISKRTPFILPEFEPLAPPVFSESGGFFEQPFELTLETSIEDAHIYFTTDGSEPTINSFQYNMPILIQSRVGEPNKYAAISATSPRYIPPAGEVFKINIIRARVISDNGQTKSPTITHSFLIDEEKRYTLPMVSLVTSPEFFFDHNDGIYVMGNIYDQYYTPNSNLSPWERPANYTQSGQEWERPIHIEYFDVNGATGFSQEVNARIHGAATRERAQKSLRLYTVNEYDESETIAYEIFSGLTDEISETIIQDYKTLLLRNSGNDWEKTMFRDALMQRLVEHTSLDTQAYQPVVVFLNGEYWGIHNFRERFDEYYLENHYNISPENVTILAENDLIITGETGDEQDYLEMLEFAASSDMAEPENYTYIQSQMDINNYIDYQTAEIYFDNANWPHVNIKFWQKKTGQPDDPDAPYGHDGKWRWMLYDTDFGLGLDGGPKNAEHNSLLAAIHPEWNDWAGLLFRSLLANPEFEEDFITRFADQLNTSFEPQRVITEIDQMQSVIAPEIEEHIQRWRGSEATVEQWTDNVGVLSDFAIDRPGYVRKHLVDYFELDGTVKISLKTNSEMGYIHINTIDLLESTPGVFDPAAWTGTYFKGVPVEITAIAYPGYQFTAWETQGESLYTNHLSLELDKSINLTAVFSKK